MKVDFQANEAVVFFPWPPPPEKDELKPLGAKWDPQGKVWRVHITPAVVRWFLAHEVDVPEEIVGSLEEKLKASRAQDADADLPVPEGLEYRPFQKAGISFVLGREATLIGDDMGLGKAQPVSEPVLTPTGWRPIGDLRVGDMVIGADGYQTRVLGVYPQQDRRVVRVTMSDGSWTRCGWDHLWAVRLRHSDSSDADWRTLTTAQLLEVGLEESTGNPDSPFRRKWQIPMVEPVQYPRTKHPIDPYLLGVVLTSGYISSGGKLDLRTDEDIIIKTLRRLGRVGCPPSDFKDGGLQTNALAWKLVGLGLSGLCPDEMFVPVEYLVGSVDDRVAFLQGVLDTGGSAYGECVLFTTSSRKLAGGISQIVESLGGTAEKETDTDDVAVTITLPERFEPFRLSKEGWEYDDKFYYPPTRTIASITPEPDEDSVCIKVEASDQLYVTRHHIVTHNTIQALGVVNTDPSISSALVVCPLSVAYNWKAEAEKWLVRNLSVGVASSKAFPDADIVVTHWGIVAKQAQQLREREWDLVVLDEAHYAKNPKALRTQSLFGGRGKVVLRPLQATRKIALTGTPIPNRPIEVYPLLHWLDPNEYRGSSNFAQRYCNAHYNGFGWDVSGASNLDELQERLRSSVMIRRLKNDVLTELPPKIRQVIALMPDSPVLHKVLEQEREATAATVAVVEKAQAAAELAKAEDEETYKAAVKALHEAQALAFTEMSRARHRTAVAKVPRVLDHVKDILSNEDQKVILFAHHRDVINSLREGLETDSGEWRGVETVSIMGGDAPEDRQESVTRFQEDPNVRVFLGSIGAAREGITLTRANVVVFAEIDWVPGNLNQAEDRCMAEGSLVLTPLGWKPIEQIKLGNLVVTHTGAARRVTDIWSQESRREMAEVRVSGWRDAIVSTSDHRYLLEDGKWKQARELLCGDRMALSPALAGSRYDVPDGVKVHGVLLRRAKKTGGSFERIWDLTVETDESFVVGNVAAHNCHRMGQRDSVTIQHLLLDGSIDARMIQTIVAKQEVLEKALDTDLGKISDQPVIIHGVDNGGEEELPVSPVDPPATRSTTREQIARRAELITESEIDKVHSALRELALLDPDHALGLNGQGFSRIDVAIGHDLAGRGTLSPKQAALGAMLIAKYHGQIGQETADVWRILGERAKGSEKGEGTELSSLVQPVSKSMGLGLR